MNDSLLDVSKMSKILGKKSQGCVYNLSHAIVLARHSDVRFRAFSDEF